MNLNRRSFLEAGAAFAAGQLVKAAPNERITVGHIGAGARAHQLMQAVMANPNTEIVGVVDAYTGRVERAIDRTNGTRQGRTPRTTTCWPTSPSTPWSSRRPTTGTSRSFSKPCARARTSIQRSR